MTPETKKNDLYIIETESDELTPMFGGVSVTVTKLPDVPQPIIDMLAHCTEPTETIAQELFMDANDVLTVTLVSTDDIDAIAKMKNDNKKIVAKTHAVNELASMIHDDPNIMKKLVIAIAKKEFDSDNE